MKLRTIHLLPMGIVSTVLAGAALADPPSAWPEPRPLGSHFDAAGGDEGVAAPSESAGTLALEHALAMALLHNPELSAYAHEVRAAQARALQAGVRPNPELELGLSEFDRDGEGFDSAEIEVTLGQMFELGGKRTWRTRMAEAEGELAGWEYEQKRLEVFSTTAQRFIQVIAAQHRLDLTKSTIDVAEKTSRAVGERVKAGKEPPPQASKALAELEMARIELRRNENLLDASKRALAAMWGSRDPLFEKAEGAFETVLEEIPSLETLRSRLPMNPEMARWEAELRRSRASLSLEQSARVPDLEASIGFQHFEEDGADAVAFGVGLPLPLFDRNQGGIAAARHEVEKTEDGRRGAQAVLAAHLAEAHAILASSHGMVTALRTKVVPAMEEALTAAHAGYEEGKFDFLDMLDAQRGLFDVRVALVDALIEYHTALTDLEALTGTPIENTEHRTEENE